MNDLMRSDASKVIKAIIVVLLLVVGVSFVQAAWTGPTQVPPGNNISAPVNVSSASQFKAGSLTIGGKFEVKNSSTLLGVVGVGTTEPSSPLEVAGSVEADQYCDRTGQVCFSITDIGNLIAACQLR